jgi:hypothetical protein
VTLATYPGWFGVHTRQQEPGAIPNGARVRKIDCDRGDAHAVGTCATILGSVVHPERGFAYFVEWDPKPRVAVLVVGDKIAPIEPEETAI